MPALALFGGTFDPIHNAHLQIASAAADRCGLERILFIPSGNPPHRAEGAFASYEDRYAMVALACQADPRFEPSRLESAERKSYSIETIEAVQSTHTGALFFLIGADAFAEIQTWYRWKDVIASVTFIVVARPGADYAVPPNANIIRLENLSLAVSSSEIRKQLAAHAPSPSLPPQVRSYIDSHHLYQPAIAPAVSY